MSTPIGSAWSQAGGKSRRQTLIQAAMLHYVGNPPRPLRQRVNEPDDNVILNLAALVVDTGVSFLFGRDVGIVIGGEDAQADAGTAPEDDNSDQTWLDKCWEYNKRALTLQRLAVNGGVTGHAFLKIVPQPSQDYPRLVVLDSTQVQAIHDPDDIERVYKYVIGGQGDYAQGYDPSTVEEDDDRTAYELPARQTIEDRGYSLGATDWDPDWHVYDQQFASGSWVTQKDTPWPFPFPPIIDCQNLPSANDHWGTPDLTESITHICSVINRNASHFNKVIRLYAHPKFWVRGMGNKPIDMAIDATIHLPSEQAEMHLLEMQNDLGANDTFIRFLLEQFSYLTRTPLVAMGLHDNLGPVSGVALEIRYMPLQQKIDTKRRTYGALVIETSRRLLLIAQRAPHTRPDLTLDWPEMLPSDPLALRQELAQDLQMGLISKHTAAEKLDYDYEAEKALIDQEHADDVATQLADQAAQAKTQLASGLAAQDAQHQQGLKHQQQTMEAFPGMVQPMSGGTGGALASGSAHGQALQAPAPPAPVGAKK